MEHHVNIEVIGHEVEATGEKKGTPFLEIAIAYGETSSFESWLKKKIRIVNPSSAIPKIAMGSTTHPQMVGMGCPHSAHFDL